MPAVIISICVILCVCAAAVAATFYATKIRLRKKRSHSLTIDYSECEGKVSHCATGWLYGMAEKDVPSRNLLKALAPDVAVCKVPCGKQHPVGDLLDTAETFMSAGGRRLMVYLQDLFPDWYYVYEGQEDFLAKVRFAMPLILGQPFADKTACCPFNENENGKWYGDFRKEASRKLFYADWLAVYKVIREYSADIKIAGPGFMNYNEEYMEDFLRFCIENDCLPDITIWHELSKHSYYRFEKNYDAYRALEQKLGLSPIEICISEYGQMCDNGVPGKMVQYISMFESKKVSACIAFWRLADNLGELAADNDAPAAAWWLYHRYGEMRGNTYRATNAEPIKSRFRAVTSYDEEKRLITVIAGGGNGKASIELRNVNTLKGLENAAVLYAEKEYIEYSGLGYATTAPSKCAPFAVKVTEGGARIELENIREDKAYLITLSATPRVSVSVTPLCAEGTRYEAECAEYVGLDRKERADALYKINYAASGKGLVRNVSGKGKAVTFTVSVPKEGEYTVKVVYANGFTSEGTRASRAPSYGALAVDGERRADIVYPNTLTTSATSAVTSDVFLTAGAHKLTFTSEKGEVSYDFIDILPACKRTAREAFPLRKGGYMFVTDKAGTYEFTLSEARAVTFEGVTLAGETFSAYMRRGVNFVYGELPLPLFATPCEGKPLGYELKTNFADCDKKYLSGAENYAEYTVFAPADGVYAMNIPYSDNAEYGTHDYNVKLIERCADIEVNGYTERVWFRNTYSWQTFAERVVYIKLKAGANTVRIYNANADDEVEEKRYLPYIRFEEVAFHEAFAARTE